LQASAQPCSSSVGNHRDFHPKVATRYHRSSKQIELALGLVKLSENSPLVRLMFESMWDLKYDVGQLPLKPT